MDVKEKIDISNLPKHIAIIMDGNGRWAKQKSKLRVFGHKGGVQSVNDTVEAAAELGIKFLTLYAFSTENWSRPKKEVNALMNLLVNTIEAETKTLIKNDIKLISIGEIDELPEKHIEKNSFFDEETTSDDDFEFNQDFEIEETTRSPGWIRYQKRIK